MTYRLFLDDERFPPEGCDTLVARSYYQFVNTILTRGLPRYISFDHDLGVGKTGLDCAKWLADYCMDHKLEPTFEVYVHSQNPVGKANIESFFSSFKKNYPVDGCG